MQAGFLGTSISSAPTRWHIGRKGESWMVIRKPGIRFLIEEENGRVS